MKTILTRILTFVLISGVIYFGIAATLVLVGKPRKPLDTQQNISFDELFFDYSNLPELQTFEARDGATLSYRHYPADSDKVLVLLHGSGWRSRYFLPLAEFISAENLAYIYTPDLRGHGLTPVRRGDIDYIGQLEDKELWKTTSVSRRVCRIGSGPSGLLAVNRRVRARGYNPLDQGV